MSIEKTSGIPLDDNDMDQVAGGLEDASKYNKNSFESGSAIPVISPIEQEKEVVYVPGLTEEQKIVKERLNAARQSKGSLDIPELSSGNINFGSSIKGIF